ncbi:MAG TPA: TIGR02678 family protein [bacterium]|nr:TIGR02678 family protein [bacterium]
MSRSQRFQAERRTCVQALLNRYFITKAADPELYQTIRHHFQDLREWFQDQCGFTLLLTRKFAKLEKVPGKAHAWMGWELFSEPRDYALFSYCLWYLEGKGENEQFLLTDMVESIRQHLLGLGLEMDWTLYDHRRSMARTLKQLKTMGVLLAVDGDEWDWALQGDQHNVLYESSHYARYVLRRFPQDLSQYMAVEDLGQVFYAPTPEGELKARRHHIFRRLLQEPVVYDWEWTKLERHYVLTQRHYLRQQLETMAGLVGQRYREGLLFFYPEASGEMELFPTARAISDLVQALAAEIRRRAAGDTEPAVDERGCLALTRLEFETLLLKLRQRYGDYWSKQHRQATTSQLGEEIIEHLEQWGLGRQGSDGTVYLQPALARFWGHYDGLGEDLT